MEGSVGGSAAGVAPSAGVGVAPSAAGVLPIIDFALSIAELNADVILAINPPESDIPMTRMDLNGILTNESL
jgi:hypothetical protein